MIGTDGVRCGLAGVAVEAAGHVDGQLLCIGCAFIQSIAVSNGGRGSPRAPVPSMASMSQAAPRSVEVELSMRKSIGAEDAPAR